MTNVVHTLIAFLGHAPGILVYLIAVVWMGLESAGIGVPIEPMMLSIGSLAATTPPDIFLPLAVLCAALGCLIFAFIAYTIGQRVGTKSITRVGHYVGLNQERADHIELWLRHRGGIGVFIARQTPMVRTFGSYIMGAADIPKRTFLISTFLGSLLYCGIFITLGALLGSSYEKPLDWLDSHVGFGAYAIVIGVIIGLLVLHHFWGRFARHRLALHYHHHMAEQAKVATPAPQAPQGTGA